MSTDAQHHPIPDDATLHKNIFRIQTKADVFQKYEVIDVFVGSGSMGSVSKVRLREEKIGGSAFHPHPKNFLGKVRNKLGKKTEENRPKKSQEYVYALKSILLDRISPTFIEELKNEIEILRCLDHPNIVKAHEVFIRKNKEIYLVLEYCSGGDLYTRAPYSEKEAARIVSKLCSAVRYMHEHSVIHRDLKFENIMFESETSSEIKVLDFGLSKMFLGKPGLMTERVGTIYTMAPQVLQGVYSSQADLWSVGVISYMLLSSSKPFYSKDRRRMIDQIMRGAFSFQSPVWDMITDDAKDFVRKLLVVDPRKRMNAYQAIHHSWIVNRENHPEDTPPEDVLLAIDDSLLNYRQTSKLKKLALTLIAHRSTSKEILELRKVFDAFDTEKNGVLSYDEFKGALEKMGYNEDEMSTIFSSIDLNRNGYIMYTEFLAATIELHGQIEEDRIAEAFDRLDSDNTGYISRENLIEYLGKDSEEVDAIIATSDRNGDGKISYDEFLECFRERRAQMVKKIKRSRTVESPLPSSDDLLGLDAKIPGGAFESHLC